MTFHSTTILALRHKSELVIAGDGQVTVSNTVMKHTAVKIRKLLDGEILGGFAGSAADGFSLFERFEEKLNSSGREIRKAAVELAKDWRSDRALRRLEAMLIVANKEHLFVLSGAGDVLQPDHDVVAIGSGGNFAYSAALALVRHSPEMSAREIAKSSMEIAGEICPFTNSHLTIESLK